jgi:hypothetical protein
MELVAGTAPCACFVVSVNNLYVSIRDRCISIVKNRYQCDHNNEDLLAKSLCGLLVFVRLFKLTWHISEAIGMVYHNKAPLSPLLKTGRI